MIISFKYFLKNNKLFLNNTFNIFIKPSNCTINCLLESCNVAK